MKDKHKIILLGTELLFDINTFCVNNDKDDIVYTEQNKTKLNLYEQERNQICNIKYMTLHIIHDCILHCEYCYGSGGTYGKPNSEYMSEETIVKAIDYLFYYSGNNDKVHINFFGGEPLMSFDKIKFAVDYALKKADEKSKKTEFSVSTCGLILNDNILEFLKSNEFSVSVSIDGDKENHNLHRKYLDKSNSYEDVISGFNKLKRYSITTLVTATLTRKTIQALDNIDALLDIGSDNFRFKTVTGDLSDLNLSKDDFITLAQKYEKLAEKYLQDIEKGNIYDFGDFTKWIQRLYKGVPVVYNCSATENYVNVDPKGEIFICHKFVGSGNGYLGNVYDIDSPVKPLGFDLNLGNCKKCWARNVCGGGCYYDGFEQNGNVYLTANTNKCIIYRAQIEAAIYIYYDLSKKNAIKRFIDKISSSHNAFQLTV